MRTKTMMRVLFTAFGWLLLASCADGTGVARVMISSSSTVAKVASFRVTVTSGGSTSDPISFPLASPVTLPPAQSIGLRFDPSHRGTMTIAVTALDGSGNVLAAGTTMVDVEPSKSVDAAATIAPRALQWTPIDGKTTADFSSVWGTNDRNVYIAGTDRLANKATVLHSTDGGNTWNLNQGFPNTKGIAVWGIDAGNVFLTTEGTIYLADTGDDWRSILEETTVAYFRLWGTYYPNELWAVGSQGIIARSNGTSWQTIYQDPSRSELDQIWGAATNDIYVPSPSGLLHSSDGASWSILDVGIKQPGIVWGTGSDDVFVIGAGDALAHKRGQHWTSVATGAPSQALGIWATGTGDVYLAGLQGLLMHSPDDGVTWSVIDAGVKNNLMAIWGSGPSDIYVVGEQGVILHGH